MNFSKTYSWYFSPFSLFFGLVFSCVFALAAALPTAVLAADILVSNSNAFGAGSLYDAVNQANTNSGSDTIKFAVSNSITVSSTLILNEDTIIEGGGVTIGAYGTGCTIFKAPVSNTGRVEFKNMALVDVTALDSAAIEIGSNGNFVVGCAIGTDWQNITGRGNTNGILLRGSAFNNTIGQDRSAGLGNIISGNTIGINLAAVAEANSPCGNWIIGNIIGLTSDETAALSNQIGIMVNGGVGNHIGDSVIHNENVISGNIYYGILITGDSYYNLVTNNYIGTNTAATPVSFGNDFGIYNESNSGRGNLFGGLIRPPISDYERNRIAANRIGLYLAGAGGNTVCGNLFSTDNATATLSISGCQFNVLLNSSNNWIGGTAAYSGAANYILAGQYGIRVSGASMAGNYFEKITIMGCTTAHIQLDTGCNHSKQAPVIIFANLATVWGTSDPGDAIEIYRASDGAGGHGGSMFLFGKVIATSSGAWSYSFSAGAVSAGDYICAIATGADTRDSSMFSLNAQVIDGLPTVTPTVTPTATISPTITPTASPTLVRTAFYELLGQTALAFPNPAKGQMNFVLNLTQAGEVVVRLYNLSGEAVAKLSGKFPAQNGCCLTWDCRQAAPGIYLARVFVQGEEVRKMKVAVQRK